MTLTSRLRNINPIEMLKRNEVAEKRLVGSHCGTSSSLFPQATWFRGQGLGRECLLEVSRQLWTDKKQVHKCRGAHRGRGKEKQGVEEVRCWRFLGAGGGAAAASLDRSWHLGLGVTL